MSGTGTNTSNDQPVSADTPDTVTVHVWQGKSYEDSDTLVEETDPDVYELPVVDPHSPWLVSDDDRVLLADDIEHHGTYAFDIPHDSRPVTLNVCSNDSYHDPDDWGKPVERGLTFYDRHDDPPFKCEIWGRIMMYVSPLEEPSRED